MRISTWLLSLLQGGLIVAVPVILFFTPLYVFVTPAFVRHQYAQPHFPPAERFAPDERLRLSDAAVDYLHGRVSREALASLRTVEGETAFNAREVAHLVDVKHVIDAMLLAHAGAVILGALCGLVLWRAGERGRVSMGLTAGVWLAGGLIALIVVSALLDFDTFFTEFHRIFFAEGTWIFDYRDTLIQLYPIVFWMDAVWKMSAVIGVEAVVVLLIARWLRAR
jgi:integral membrane protein (TIGR01906 family)